MRKMSDWGIELKERTGIVHGKPHKGVYCIKLKATDEIIYIGSTKNLHNRCAAYYGNAVDYTHDANIWMHNHKGEWYFDVLSIRDDLTIKELRLLEKEYQLKYKPMLCKCYGDDKLKGEDNLLYGVKKSEEYKQQYCYGENNPRYGKHCSEETKQKIRERVSGDSHSKAKKTLCVELNKLFGSAREAARWLQENGHPTAQHSGIIDCCNGARGRKTAYGYHWKWAG